MNNNKMERMNGEISDREKMMRGLKNTRLTDLQGIQIYHNFVRPHMALTERLRRRRRESRSRARTSG